MAVLDGRGEQVQEWSVLVAPEVYVGAIQVLSEIFNHSVGLCRDGRQSLRVYVPREDRSADHRPGSKPRGVALGKAEQITHDTRGDELRNGHEISGASVEPLSQSLAGPAANGLLEGCHGLGGESRLKDSSMDGVNRLVSGGDDASLELGHREDRGIAWGSHQDACEIRGEVRLAGEHFLDQIPRRDEVYAGLGDAG